MESDALMPSIERFREIGEPKREIDLDDKTEKLVASSIKTLDLSGLDLAAVFDIFHDWKSRLTIAARRVLLSLSVLVGGSYWIGIDLSEASIWGLSLGEASLDRFLILASAILLASTFVYLVSRQLDSRVRSAKIARTTEVIKPCRRAARNLEKVVTSNRLVSVDNLLDDFSGLPSLQPSAKDSYDAVIFYEKELENAHTTRRWIDLVEMICVLGIGLYALYAISQLAWASVV